MSQMRFGMTFGAYTLICFKLDRDRKCRSSAQFLFCTIKWHATLRYGVSVYYSNHRFEIFIDVG